jgi:hypothetical protein
MMSNARKEIATPLAEAKQIADAIVTEWQGWGGLRNPDRERIALTSIATALKKIVVHCELLMLHLEAQAQRDAAGADK